LGHNGKAVEVGGNGLVSTVRTVGAATWLDEFPPDTVVAHVLFLMLQPHALDMDLDGVNHDRQPLQNAGKFPWMAVEPKV
jgi:hypothetical protein